jgi:SAM-dependent methyltransferase
MKIQNFEKYRENSSYHWKKTQGNFLEWSPRLTARYEIAIQLATGHKDIRMLQGLDLGCGDGAATFKIRERGGYIIGLDGEISGIELAKHELRSRNFNDGNLLVGNCYDLPFESESFDYVISIELIEHLANVDLYLAEIQRVLKHGGTFVCSTPQRLDGQGEFEVRDPYHEKEYSAEELRDALAQKFDNVDVWGAFPGYLDQLYLRFVGIGFVDAAFKLLFKFYCKFFANIYLSKVMKNPTGDYQQLFARVEKI